MKTYPLVKVTESPNHGLQLPDSHQEPKAAREQLPEAESSQNWDLDDKDSVIAELKAQVGSYDQEQQKQKKEICSLQDDLEKAREECDSARKEEKQAREELVRIQTERDRLNKVLDETRENLNETRENLMKLTDGSLELETIRRRIDDMEKEKGQALDELRELNERYQRDRRYVVGFEMDSEERFDKLEKFKVKLAELDGELRRVLEEGLKGAHLFRNSFLLDELEKKQKEISDVLRELTNLAEDYNEEDEHGKARRGEQDCTNGVMKSGSSDFPMVSSGECKEMAKGKLTEYEEVLREMYKCAEETLTIKNTITFSS